GVALVDSALIDAACRQARVSFHGALKANLFGYGGRLAELLPEHPLERIAARHTVGLADPILDADIGEPVNDGLPESLEQVVRQYRTRFFKIKITGDAQASRERLRSIASVLDAQAGDYRATLDGNEQFHDMADFAAFIREARPDAALRNLWDRTLFIEQPVGRAHSLLDAVAEPLQEISRFKPMIIDESDGDDETVERALALGYQGISAKNCKGVFRTLHSYLALKDAEESGKPPLILSSEDLTNVPALPLQQDLCVAAALGISHSERNGHHYIVGFDFLSPREREDALREFPSLYVDRADREGANPVVRIENGFINAADINLRGFGGGAEPDWDALEPVRLPEIPADMIGDGSPAGRIAS
ncbi:MAG: mandelate racemase, partial [Fibrobacteria bacterium]